MEVSFRREKTCLVYLSVKEKQKEGRNPGNGAHLPQEALKCWRATQNGKCALPKKGWRLARDLVKEDKIPVNIIKKGEEAR